MIKDVIDKKEVEQNISVLRPEFQNIVWDYNITPEDFLNMLFCDDPYRKTWATARLLMYATWKTTVRLLGVKEILDRWKDVQKQVKRTKYTEQLYINIDWLEKYVASHR